MLNGQPWPIELFQATLLTLIFSLYRTDKNSLSKSMFLRSVFVTILRDTGIFEGDILAAHLKNHFSGAYAPYTLSMREQFTRLLALTYQFDTYFALVYETPPIIHRQEIGAGLTCTFALWNAHGLDIFAKRMREEPTERFRCQISKMTDYPDSFTSSHLLVEDVLLGLCGSLQEIWVLRQSSLSNTKDNVGNAFRRGALIETLNAWTRELVKINEFANTRHITRADGRYLLLAYRGEDDSAAATSERVAMLVTEGRILSHCLKMYHYSNLSSSRFVYLLKPTEDPSTETWRTTKHGRDALVCALQMLELVESIEVSHVSINPLVGRGLAMGADLTRRVLVSTENCECIANERPCAPEMDLNQWVEIGGPLWMKDNPVCVCSLRIWTEKFEKAIRNQQSNMESAGSSESTEQA